MLRTCEVGGSYRILKDCSSLTVPYLCRKVGNYPRKRHGCECNTFLKTWLNNIWQKIILTRWSDSESDTHTGSSPQCNASMSQDLSGLVFFSPNEWVCQLSCHVRDQRFRLIHDSLCTQWTRWSCLIMTGLLLPGETPIRNVFSYRLLRLSLFFTATFPSVQNVTKTEVIRSSNWVEDSIFFKKRRMWNPSFPYFIRVLWFTGDYLLHFLSLFHSLLPFLPPSSFDQNYTMEKNPVLLRSKLKFEYFYNKFLFPRQIFPSFHVDQLSVQCDFFSSLHTSISSSHWNLFFFPSPDGPPTGLLIRWKLFNILFKFGSDNWLLHCYVVYCWLKNDTVAL